jgi:ketosteroid isomerase-like protein
MTEPTTPASTATAGEVHRRNVELFGLGRREEALLLIAPDVIDHRGGTVGDRHGRDAWRDKWEHMDDDGQDVSVTIEQNVTSGEFSVNRYAVRGSRTGSGKHYEVTSIDMVRVRDGQIVEHWALLDTTAARHQLGLRDAES